MIVADFINKSKEKQDEIIILSKLMSDKIKPIFPVKEFHLLKYKNVINLKSLSLQDDSDSKLLKKIAKYSGWKYTDSKVSKARLSSYFATIRDIKNNFIFIKEKENLLITETDSKLITAGIEELNQFGNLNTIDSLAGGDILNWKEVINLQWWDVFNKLYKNKIENKIKEKLNLINST